MYEVAKILKQGQKAIQDLNLLKIIQSEIKYELSSNRFQDGQSGSPGDFVVDYDSPKSQDVVLRKKCDSGKEVAISALLSPNIYNGESVYPREVFMKVCISKPGLSSLLQFNCGVSSKSNDSSELDIRNAYLLPSKASLDPSVYRGPLFSTLDPNLQDAFKDYLEAKGVGEHLRNFLLHHLHKKEQRQYVDWLHRLESLVGKDH